MKSGFTLIEMLVVMGIIAILVGASIGGYSAMTKAAERTKAQELVSNTAAALTALFQKEGVWPQRLISGNNGENGLDADAAYALVAGDRKYLSLNQAGNKLIGLDRFGVVSPWATAVIKRKGTSASQTDIVSGKQTIKDHTLRYALDLDGDGIIRGATVGGVAVNIRATAAVWCCGKDGVIDPYPFASGGGNERGANTKSGGRSDDIYSWTPGQTRGVE